MSVQNTELIASTTSAATSAGFFTVRTAVIMANPLSDGESITVQQTLDGSTWQDMTLNGVSQQITATHTLITLTGPGKFRITKSVTASPVSVNLWRGQ